MNVYAISDLHLSINNPKPMNIFGAVWDNYLDTVRDSLSVVTDDDILLLAGDLSWAMKLEDARADIDYIATFPGKKIIIRGNHDYWWDSVSKVRDILPPNVYALQNDCVKIGNFIVAGSRGWSIEDKTEQGEKLIAREVIRMELSLKSAQAMREEGDRLISMIHYPPFNMALDASPFTNLFERYGVDAVVYGHLHGRSVCRLKYERAGIDYYLTSCDKLQNRAIKIF